ncbi:MAG: 2-oxoacid:acceptor oxidoreductase family protein [Spirochaetota bacterium]
MTERIIIAGFGGQGIILAGKLLAYGGMVEDKYVSHIPSYGAEMRGGTANCAVIISSREVASPLVPHPSTLIVMNEPSLIKFERTVNPGGNIFVNRSLIGRRVARDDVHVYYIPANNIAEEAGSSRASNMVMVGAFITVTGIVSAEVVKDSLDKVVSKRNIKYNDINREAIDRACEYIREERSILK